MTKDIRICLGVDVDAVAGWLGSYGGADSPNDVQRGVFAGEIGIPRMLTLFRRHGIRTSWFVPGHSIETFPEQTRMIVEAGHEIGAHGYSHENPLAMTPRQEEDVLAKCVELIEEYTGRRPRGYVAPWWEMSPHTAELLHTYGFSNEVDLVEFCGNWYVDDLPPMMFNKHAHNSHGFVSPRELEQTWRDQFDWVHRELDYAVVPVTLHPDVSGRPQVLLMLERFIDYVGCHDGVTFCTLEDAADDFRRRFPFAGTERPADMR
ncbi:polysaccharide deacetylase [Streptomyces sp. NPDC057743]|uniref:polysaccharide deacetylase family protein n=1 Tax=Streptomyces sp. NPDC057743 TaxID=3346236 RepID=UPI0036A11099